MKKLSVPRLAKVEDFEKIWKLYQRVAQNLGGLAREADEVTPQYIAQLMQKSAKTGFQWVIENLEDSEIVAEIHCYKLEPRTFSHILSELTICVHPHYQGRGVGKTIFAHLLHHIRQHCPDILRVELVARESNQKAIVMYQKLGFVIEGRFERRIRSADGNFEADIPMAWFNS
jgi:ribosomal protein S18 acetylase RimI-like enzyme